MADITLNKIKAVNDYYNSFTYVPDIINFNSKDYWQTPTEFENNKCGDCEDFAIAKFFKLRSLYTVPNLYYCLYGSEPHMVCVCNGLVLDNINKHLILFEDSELEFIYRFNTTNWNFIKDKMLFGNVTSINNLKLWKDLLSRMDK